MAHRRNPDLVIALLKNFTHHRKAIVWTKRFIVQKQNKQKMILAVVRLIDRCVRICGSHGRNNKHTADLNNIFHVMAVIFFSSFSLNKHSPYKVSIVFNFFILTQHFKLKNFPPTDKTNKKYGHKVIFNKTYQIVQTSN